jgi:1-acyl-sn-glycerol-3-phosphate acyltransferase
MGPLRTRTGGPRLTVIRTVLILLVGTILTFALSAWVRFSGLIRAPWAHDHCSRASAFWGRSMVRLAGVKVRLEGADREKLDRPLVVVANHQSWFDVFVLGGFLPGRARFVAKEELRRIPLFGAAWETCGHVRVNRGDRAEAVRSLNEAGDRIRKERLNVILFPEGTRSPDGRLLPFKKGAFVLALQTGVPILPVGISGSRAVMGKGSFRIRPGEIRVRIGEPIELDGLTTADRDAVLARARREILALMEDPDGTPDQSIPAAVAGPNLAPRTAATPASPEPDPDPESTENVD